MNLHASIYIFLTITVFLLIAALLCSLAENTLDIVFLGAGIASGAVAIHFFKKLREERKSRFY